MSNPLAVTANPAESGHCGQCGRELIRTATDCWHPAGQGGPACPPEDYVDGVLTPRFGRFGRPGRENWFPGPPLPPAAPSVPKIVEAELMVKDADGARTIIRFAAEDGGTLLIELANAIAAPPSIRVDPGPIRRSDQENATHTITIGQVGRWEMEHLVRQVP